VLDAGLHLFSHHGYRATTVRDIADRAGVSTGNLYHHFPDKEAIFRALLDEYTEITDSPRFPYMRVLYSSELFPDNLEALGFAARDSVRQYRDYLALVYVDVIEFGGTHIQRLYASLSDRFARYFETQGRIEEVQTRLRPNVSPVSALLLASRLYFNSFSLEILFNVAPAGGKDSSDTVREIADIVRNGVCAR